MLAPHNGHQLLALQSSMIPCYQTTFQAMSSGYRSLYLERSDLDQEDVRLQTFLLWPKWAPKSLTKERMAKAGLYFTGDSDIAKCFKCKVALGRWKKGESPLERHRQLAPQCPFLAGLESTDEDDLVVDGEDDECEDVDTEEEEGDCVDGATADILSGNSSFSHDVSCLTSSNVNNLVKLKEKQCNEINKNQLKNENAKLRKAMLCRKCDKERIQTLFLPCRHLVTCEECADKMENCIECDQRILGTVRTFMV